jgi:hypothetical protein
MSDAFELKVTNDQRQALVTMLREATAGGGYENAFAATIIKQARWSEAEEDFLLARDERAAVHNLSTASAPADEKELKERFNSLRTFRAEQRAWGIEVKIIKLSKEAGSFLKTTLKKEMKGAIAEQLNDLLDQLP